MPIPASRRIRQEPKPLAFEPPRYFRPAITHDPFVAIEHAALDSRADQLILARALGHIGASVIVTADFARIRWRLRQWFPKLATQRFLMKRSACHEIGPHTIWLLDPEGDPESVPSSVLSFLGALGCERMPESPAEWFSGRVTGQMLLTGQLSDRGHWFHTWARRTEVLRVAVTADDITNEWADQKPHVLSRSHPRYTRAMAVRDELAPQPSIRIFASKRLFVRTDKGATFFSDRQAAAAQQALGEDWRRMERAAAIVPLDISRLQRRYLAQKRLGRARGYRKFLVVKARRMGVTTIEQALSYQMADQRPYSQIATLGTDYESIVNTWEMVKLYHERDPEAPRLLSNKGGRWKFANGSVFFVGSAEKANFGRGDTLQRVHGLEVARWRPGPNHIAEMNELWAGLSQAASAGECIAETTTAGRNWTHVTWLDAKKRINDWWPIFLRWFDDPSYRFEPSQFNIEEVRDTLAGEEKELIRVHRLSLGQIAWRRMKKRELDYLFEQEYPEDDETCFLTAGLCFFPVDKLLDLLKSTIEFPRRALPGGYEIIWEEPIADEEYVAGVDCSEGLKGGDPNGCGILKKKTGKQVATVHGLFSPAVLGEHSVRLCRKYNNALLGVERNNHGHAVLLRIKELGYGRSHLQGGRLFFHPPFGEDHRNARAGWDTNPRTRDLMIDELREAVVSDAMGVMDRDFISECLSFRLQTSGKWQHDPSAHDDTIFKWGIAHQMRRHRRNAPGIEFSPTEGA